MEPAKAVLGRVCIEEAENTVTSSTNKKTLEIENIIIKFFGLFFKSLKGL